MKTQTPLERIKENLVKILKDNPTHIVCVSKWDSDNVWVEDFEGRLVKGTNSVVVAEMISKLELTFIGYNWMETRKYKLAVDNNSKL